VRAGAASANVRWIEERSGRLGFALGITSSTQALLLDAKRRLRYRGAVGPDLVAAIEALLAGGRVTTAETEAGGTPLQFEAPKGEAPPVEPPPTWHGEIRRLVEAKCQQCHHVGGGGPFP
jgi:hypothetical protein